MLSRVSELVPCQSIRSSCVLAVPRCCRMLILRAMYCWYCNGFWMRTICSVQVHEKKTSSHTYYTLFCLLNCTPAVLRRCWLGSRKSIRPAKNWGVGCWRAYLSGARCRLAHGPADSTATHCLASVKSRLVLPLCYRLTHIVLDKGPLNGCVCVYM